MSRACMSKPVQGSTFAMIEPSEGSKQRLVRFLPMLLVCAIIAILYKLYIFYHCLPLFQFKVAPERRDYGSVAKAVIHFLVAHAGTFMVVWCFYKTCSTDPGGIPETGEWRRQMPPSLIHERKKDGGARYCHKCSMYKPDRCHHSRNSGRCVLKMDHHCPWVANDIGYFNYKFFCLTLVYSGATLAFCCITQAVTLPAAFSDSNISFGQIFFVILGTALSFFMLAIVLPFCCFHLWLMAVNCTSIEFCEKRRTGRHHPYNMGLAENLRQALGDQPLLWCVPVGGPSGDGISFPHST